jgi:gamma-glutamylcyclotransferase (GGCT)/AIG2-like uncharacterized protein YtfP
MRHEDPQDQNKDALIRLHSQQHQSIYMSMLTPTLLIMLQSSSSSSLFVYGTLMAPEVMQTLLGRLPPSTRGTTVSGRYARHPVRNRLYPGMIIQTTQAPAKEESSSVVEGIVYYNLQPNELRRLDWFEDVDYTRTELTVQLLNEDDDNASSTLSTQGYLWTNSIKELDTSRDWNFADFVEKDLQRYLLQTVQPCRDELDQRKT